MKILVIDNYDSFTYNLAYILRQENTDVTIYRNDKIEPKECLKYNAMILSPGPGIPQNAGNLTKIIKTCARKVPILGVCLGHQAIAEYLGSSLQNLDKVYHGVQSTLVRKSSTDKLFKNISKEFQAGRYHSWDVTPSKDENFEVIAIAEDESIMAIQNVAQQLYGIQFHPESILTPEGDVMIKNFLSICKDLKQ